jgi:hypothetical protein
MVFTATASVRKSLNMAEIKIEKKSPAWPWILLTILLVAAFVYYLVATNKVDVDENGVQINDDRTEQVDTDTSLTR